MAYAMACVGVSGDNAKGTLNIVKDLDTLTQDAMAYCRQSLVPRILPLAALERGTAQVLALEAGALLLYDPSFEGHMLCWDDEAAARRLLGSFEGAQLLMMEHATLEQEARAMHGFAGGMVCYSCAYLSAEALPVSVPVALRLLSPEALPLVLAHHRGLHQDTLAHALREGRLYGGWAGEELVGFIGLHDEESVGMLYVLELHRRRGYARAMEAQLINQRLQRGERVFGQIRVGNEASIALHRSMGYAIADTPGSWHWQ